MCGACIAVERDEKTKYIGRDATLGCATQVCVCFFFLGTMYGWDSCPAPHHAQLTDRRNGRRNEGCEMNKGRK